MSGSTNFRWGNVKEVFDKIENFTIPPLDRYVHVSVGDHGTGGPVNVEYAQKLEKHIPGLLRGVEEFGWKLSKDLNSGDPIGVGLCPATAKGGVRVTAQSAYLARAEGNLEVRTGWPVARVLFKDGRAVGVESVDGKKSTLFIRPFKGKTNHSTSFRKKRSCALRWSARFAQSPTPFRDRTARRPGDIRYRNHPRLTRRRQ